MTDALTDGLLLVSSAALLVAALRLAWRGRTVAALIVVALAVALTAAADPPPRPARPVLAR